MLMCHSERFTVYYHYLYHWIRLTWSSWYWSWYRIHSYHMIYTRYPLKLQSRDQCMISPCWRIKVTGTHDCDSNSRSLIMSQGSNPIICEIWKSTFHLQHNNLKERKIIQKINLCTQLLNKFIIFWWININENNFSLFSLMILVHVFFSLRASHTKDVSYWEWIVL